MQNNQAIDDVLLNAPFYNDIVVEIDGEQHKKWTRYDIDSDFLIPADAFSFDIGVPHDHTNIPDFAGKEAKVMINDEVVLTGIIDGAKHTISKGNRTFSLTGRDKASILVDCSAPITNVKGLTVLDAVKKIVNPLGIKDVKLLAENNPTLDKVDIEPGETAWTAVIRCANAAGLHAWFSPDGVLIVGGADYSTPPVATLCCLKDGKRNNFSHASILTDISQRFSEVTFLGQKHGRSDDKNKNDLKWVYSDSSVAVYRPKTVVLGDVENLEALKKQAKKFITDAVLESFTLTITIPDHKTEAGILWQPGQRVHVVCDEYEIDEIFFVMGRRFTLSKSTGTQTELRLKQDGVWTPDAYKAKADSARKRKGKKPKKDLIALGGD